MKKLLTLCTAGLSLLIIIFAIVRILPVSYAQTATTTASTSAAASSTATNSSSSLQSQIDANNQQIVNLNQEIAQYQQEIQQTGADKKTLQQAINSLDLKRSEVEAQVSSTQLAIGATQLQIQQLGGQIQTTQQMITTEQAGLGGELRILQKTNDQSLLVQTLSSSDLSEVWDNVNATLQMQKAIETDMQQLQSEENNLADSQVASKQKQSALTSQQQSLAAQQESLVQTEQSKSQLLVETDAQESTYEKLLSAAQAQLASFSTFTQNAGGSKLLGNQTICDSWGCYYNQRDTAWGSDSLDGTKYTLASDGCLVTAMAMVMTHYGYKDVTPVTINSNSGNFAAYYPASLLLTISVDGITATRKQAAIDATLATGNPVIIGLNAYGGTHYVVFISGSKGNYIMRDPYIANGDDVSFSASYSMKDIFGISKVIINS